MSRLERIVAETSCFDGHEYVELLGLDFDYLIARVERLETERDEASSIVYKEGWKAGAVSEWDERNAAFLAENRLLLEEVYEWCRREGYDEQSNVKDAIPLTLAEVKRVERLEKVAEAAKEVSDIWAENWPMFRENRLVPVDWYGRLGVTLDALAALEEGE